MDIKIQMVNGMSIGMSVPDALIGKVECGKCQPLTGDVNGDGKVDQQDAKRIMEYLSGTADLDDDAKKAADVDGDGHITYLDAMTIMDVLAGTAK